MKDGSLRIGPISFNTAILFWELASPPVWVKFFLFSIFVKKLDNASNTTKKIEIEDKIAKILMNVLKNKFIYKYFTTKLILMI